MITRYSSRGRRALPRQVQETTHQRGKVSRANPEDFAKETSGVRERMTRDVKEMPPEERMKQGM